MFAVYGLSGPVFRGTLEDLGLMAPVRGVRRSDAVKTIGRSDSGDAVATPPYASSTSATQAIAEYRSMLPRELERGPLYHAEQLMQSTVVTVAEDEAVSAAWRTLIEHRIHQAPVLDAQARLVGIVSERDLLTSLNVEADAVRDVMARRVRDVMSTPVVAAAPLTDIRRIARAVLERGVGGVPIVSDGGLLLGFISRSDILRAVVTDPPLSVWQ